MKGREFLNLRALINWSTLIVIYLIVLHFVRKFDAKSLEKSKNFLPKDPTAKAFMKDFSFLENVSISYPITIFIFKYSYCLILQINDDWLNRQILYGFIVYFLVEILGLIAFVIIRRRKAD